MRTLNKLLACAMALVVPLYTWAQTEIEPNDNTTTATPVTYNTAMAGSIGACAPTNISIDYFTFTPPQQGVLRIQTTMSNSGATNLNVSVVLRNSSNAVLQTFTATAGANNTPTNNTFLHNCAGTGVYYISIPNPGSGVCTNYSFTYDIVAPVFGNDAEPNQNTTQAVVVAAGVDHDGRSDFLYGDDIDYFRLQAPNDGVMTVTFLAEHAGATPGTMTLYLRDNVNNAMETWTVNVGASGAPATNVFTRTCIGTENVYYLEPYSPSSCGVSYRFNYTVAAPAYADDAEPNQTLATAIVANAGVDTDGRVSFNYDNNFDYFRLQAPNDGVMTVTFLAEHAGATPGTMILYLRNNVNNAMETWTVNVGANGVPASNVFTRTCIGTENVYYLEPYSPSMCGVSYRFNYTVTPPLFADDTEPNQNGAEADTANANTDYDGRSSFNYDNDVDYFVLQAPNDGVMTVTFLAEHAGAAPGTMTLYLRNNVNNALETWTVNVGANGAPASNVFTRTCIGTENVYLLEPYSPAMCGVSYRFNYTVAAPVFADDTEPNQSGPLSALIDLNAAPVDGRLTFNYDNDFDYFRINHPGGPINVITQAEQAGVAGTMTVYIRNSSNNALVTNSSVLVGGNSTPALDTTTLASAAAGVYYIETYSLSICGVSYRLDCYDDDQDGVCNTGDLCANTPTGEGVNSNGCSCSQVTIDDSNTCTLDECLNGNVTHTFQDADGDGVCDANDDCPGTAAGAGVNADGCSCAQVTVNDNDPCTLDECLNGVVTHTPITTDTDGDGIPNCSDDCPNVTGEIGSACNDGNACTTGDVLNASCNCVGTPDNTDTDGDGIPNCSDDCPNVTGEIGSACNDGNACTTGDVLNASCNCVGTPDNTDTDGDGIPNCSDDCPNAVGEIGSPCNDGNACTTGDVLNASCNCVGTPDNTDTDGDGIPNCTDDCPNAVGEIGSPCNDNDVCTTGDVLNASCNCAGTFADADADGTCDANDVCPGGPEPGTACNDGNPNTETDLIQANCACVGTPIGAPDCNGVVGGPAVAGTPCNDNNACTTNDLYTGVFPNCGCAGTFADADGDGTCDANDLCPGGPEPGTACNDNDPCTTGDVIGTNCNCAGTPDNTDTDGDGIPNCSDDCPAVTGEIGSPCNDGNACTDNDVLNASCQCAGTPNTTDTDGDEVPDCQDDCPNVTGEIGSPCNDNDACTTGDVLNASCTCAGTFADADADGTCDANDVCPGGPEPGTACNDGNASTDLDVIQANCQCVGTPIGATDCNGVVGGPAVAGTPCNDNNACTINDLYTGTFPNCGCAGTFADADGDGTCDASDVCPGGPEPGTACNDNDPCTTGDVIGTNCTCAGTFQDTDSDGTCDANDACPLLPNLIPGDPCNDNNAGTDNDVVGANCICAGTPTGCTNNLDLVFSTDANASQTTWEIIPSVGGAPACSGGGLAPSAEQSVPCCLADGCWRLRVMDTAGDGMTSNGFTGGYILQTSGSAQRILDNRNNFSTGSLSAASNAGFCLPLGTNKLIFSSCDKLDWVTGQYIVASANPSVSALWNAGSTPAEATTGYEFQIFNPNGGYVFNRFRNHATSDGFTPDNAGRACHMKINNWAAAQHIPAHVLMNVRVRSRVNGVNSAWGPVCRFKIDPERAACPLAKLNDVAGDFMSCGVTRHFGPGSNYIYAKPVTGANKYQFRFRIAGESFETVRTSNNYILQLNWITNPLQDGETYDVDVRVSKNGGVTWCTDPAPLANPWGDICQVTIDNAAINGGNENLTIEEAASLRMYPNPNRGDQLYLSLEAVEEGVQTVSVDIIDLFGKQVSTRTIAVQSFDSNSGGFINTVLDLEGTMANGIYMVNITAGEQRFTERLVIQR